MYTVSLIAAPKTANLHEELLDELAARWNGAHEKWLNPGIAGEFEIPSFPDDLEQVRTDLQTVELDLAVQPRNGRRKRVLLADMDSTIIEQECIDELADMAGVGAKVAEITSRAMNGELDFHESLIERVGLLAGLQDTVIDEVLKTRITLAPGGRELVATMRANGAYTALVSGGFTCFTSVIADWLGFDENRANILLTEEGVLTGHVALPVLGREAKAEALEQIAISQGVDFADVMAVGDGANDLGMLQLSGAGVALHAKPSVARQAKLRINHGDLTALLYLQGYSVDDFVTG